MLRWLLKLSLLLVTLAYFLWYLHISGSTMMKKLIELF